MPEVAIISSIELLLNSNGEVVLQRKEVDIEDFKKVFNTFTPDYPLFDDVVTLVNTFQSETQSLSDYIGKHYLVGRKAK